MYDVCMKTNIYLGVCLTLLTAMLLVSGCSKGSYEAPFAGNARAMIMADGGSVSPVVGRARGETQAFDMAEPTEDFSAASGTEVEMERKLAKRAHLRIRVENLETADASVSNLMTKFDAYAASTSAEENSRFYSLRVPAHHYDTFLAEMSGMGRLLGRNETTEDVTLRFYDLEGRVASKRELLQTFQTYLRRANNIEEILAVEARIAELQFDIENTATQLRFLANRVDYSTIDLQLLGPAAASQRQSVTFGERIRQIFGGFGSFLAGFAVIIIGFIVYGVPILLFIFLLYWLFFGKIGLLKKLWRSIKHE